LCELWYERRWARQRALQRADRDMTLAWHVEWVRVVTESKQRMPELRTLLHAGRQRPANQLAVLQELSEQYGIPLKARLNVRVKGEAFHG
jgi:hypothetical protein